MARGTGEAAGNKIKSMTCIRQRSFNLLLFLLLSGAKQVLVRFMGLPTSDSRRRTAILQVLNAVAVGGWRGGDGEKRDGGKLFQGGGREKSRKDKEKDGTPRKSALTRFDLQN